MRPWRGDHSGMIPLHHGVTDKTALARSSGYLQASRSTGGGWTRRTRRHRRTAILRVAVAMKRRRPSTRWLPAGRGRWPSRWDLEPGIADSSLLRLDRPNQARNGRPQEHKHPDGQGRLVRTAGLHTWRALVPWGGEDSQGGAPDQPYSGYDRPDRDHYAVARGVDVAVKVACIARRWFDHTENHRAGALPRWASSPAVVQHLSRTSHRQLGGSWARAPSLIRLASTAVNRGTLPASVVCRSGGLGSSEAARFYSQRALDREQPAVFLAIAAAVLPCSPWPRSSGSATPCTAPPTCPGRARSSSGCPQALRQGRSPSCAR